MGKFTATWTNRLELAGVEVSMDGKGRCLDNVFVKQLWRSVKQKDLYLHRYEVVPALQVVLQTYFQFYNQERPHQSLGYRTLKDDYESSRRAG